MAKRTLLFLAVLVGCPACSESASALASLADGGALSPDGDAAAPMADAAPSAADGNPLEDSVAASTCNSPAPARGAALGYQEYEAESAMTNGALLGPSRAVNDANVFNSIAGESSGRTAVKLSGTGQYVRFNNACTANSIVVRYVIPDSPDGSGTNSTLGLYVNGTRVASLALTSHYAWSYGNPQSTDATTNTPGDGFARHFYDEARLLLASDIPAGATVGLQQDSSDTAAYYVVDLIDLEEVPGALTQPTNSLSVADYGAKPNDAIDDGAPIQKCIDDAAAQGKDVWLPPGTYDDAATALKVQNVKIQGAGMWRSIIQGASSFFVCGGGRCQFADLSMFGDVTLRDDAHSVHAFGGAFGMSSRIDDVWMEHFTTGPWIGQSGSPPTKGMVIHGCRLRDLYADGVNLNTSTSNSTVEQSHARSTGDDAFASWSNGPGPNASNVFQFNTAQAPWRANCYAIYGGTSNSIQDSVCADTVTYPGILVAQDFSSSPFSGTTTVARNTLLRSGGGMYGKHWGAITVSGHQVSNPITGVRLEDLDIDSATFSGIFLVGPNDAIQDLTLTNVTIADPGTYGIEVDPSASGIATATNLVVTNPVAGTGLNNQAASVYTINRGGGDVGW